MRSELHIIRASYSPHTWRFVPYVNFPRSFGYFVSAVGNFCINVLNIKRLCMNELSRAAKTENSTGKP